MLEGDEMFKLDLIDTDYLKVLSLFDLILNNPSESVSKEVITEQLGMSDYLLTKVYSELLRLLSECFDDETYHIAQNKEAISMTSTYGLGRHIFFDYLLKNSHKYRLLMLIGMNAFIASDYGKRYFISTSKVYKELAELKKILAVRDISISSANELVGDEYVIRSLMMTINGMYEQHKLPVYAVKLKAIIKNHYQRDVPYNLVNKVLNYINIIKYRRKYSVPTVLIRDRIPSEVGCETLVRDIHEFIMENIHLHKKGAELEASIIGTLIHAYFSQVTTYSIEEEDTRKIVMPFLKDLERQFTKINREQLGQVEKYLNQLVYKTKHPISPDFEFAIRKDMQYYKMFFPEFFDFVTLHIKKSEESFFTDRTHYLTYHLILILVGQIDIKMLVEDLIVCIDFHEDINYHLMIKERIELLRCGNIVVTNEYLIKVDLVITDRPELYEGINVDVIVWTVPPTMNEWQVLVRKMVALRQIAKD